jgi:hypothetical protein
LTPRGENATSRYIPAVGKDPAANNSLEPIMKTTLGPFEHFLLRNAVSCWTAKHIAMQQSKLEKNLQLTNGETRYGKLQARYLQGQAR